jgi:hypothetical protein
MPVGGTRQAPSQDRQRAAGAQNLQALLLATAPKLQRSDFKHALRKLEFELLGRLQIMRSHALAAEDRTSDRGVQDKGHAVAVAELAHNERRGLGQTFLKQDENFIGRLRQVHLLTDMLTEISKKKGGG